MGSIETWASLRLIHNLSYGLPCFDRAESLHNNLSVIFHFCTRMTRKIDKTEYYVCHKMSCIVHPYFGAVMQKCCIGTSEVTRLMCSTA